MPLDGEKCLMLIKLALNRIRLQKKKRRELNENLKREVATLLVEGKEEQARIRTMTIIHEDYMSQVMTFAEHYLETLALRIDVMAAQVHCPLDVKEQVCGIIYIAPFVEKSTEMIQLREILLKHYGQELAAEMLLYKCVDPKVIDRLSRAPPSSLLIDYYLGTIAIQFEIDWEIPSDVNDSDIPAEEISDKDILGDDYVEKVAVAEGGAKNTSESLLVGDAPKHGKKVEGQVKKDNNGNWWVISTGTPPIFIPQNFLGGAREGDLVVAALDKRVDGKFSGKIVEVKNGSGGGNVVDGKVKKDSNGNTWVEAGKPGNPSEKVLFYVAPKDTNGARDSDSVKLKIHDRSDGKYSGVILQVIPNAQSSSLLMSSSMTTPSPSSLFSSTSVSSPSPSPSPSIKLNERIGTLKIDLKGNAWVFEDDKSLPPIFVSQQDLLGAKSEEKVRVALHERTDGKRSGSIVGILSRQNNLGGMTGNFLSELYRPTPTPATEKEGEIMKDINGHHWLVTSSSPSSAPPSSLSSSSFPSETLTFIDPKYLNGAENGDHVKAVVSPLPFNPSIFEARVISVLQKAETAFTQIVGTLNTKYNVGGKEEGNDRGDGEEEGVVVSNDNGQVVYIPKEGLSLNATLSTPFVSSVSNSSTKASHGDFVLVSAKRIPLDHPKSKIVKLIGQIIRIIEKGSLDFQSELHLIQNAESKGISRKSRKISEISDHLNSVGWVQHPTNPFQRILVPGNSLKDARDGDIVHVIAHQHDGHMLGEVVDIVERKKREKEIQEKANPAQEKVADEFDELSALWESGLPTVTSKQVPAPNDPTSPVKALEPPSAAFPSENSFVYENMKFVRVLNPDTKSLLPPVILEFGSSTMRFGLCTDKTPSKNSTGNSTSNSAFIPIQPSWFECSSSPSSSSPSHTEPSIVGRPIFSTTTLPSSLSSTLSSRIYVGSDCAARRGILRVHRPISAGIVTHWDDYEEILRYCFVHVLQIDVSRHPVMILMGSPATIGTDDRNKIFSIVSRQFHAPMVSVLSEPVLISRALNLDTCLVVIVGDSLSTVTPIVGGKLQTYGVRQIEIGGEKVTEKLSELLLKDGHGPFESQSEKAAVVQMKEKFCFVGEKDKQGSGSEEVQFEMKDGRVLQIRKDIFRKCTEIYFKPSLIGADDESSSLSTQITTSITLCSTNSQKDLWSNIVVCGGASQMPGFHERLLSELVDKSRIYGEFSPKIIFPGNSDEISTAGVIAWKGGAKVALAMPEESQWYKRET